MTPEQLKSSIFQYAIQGKLVEQREEDGTADDLWRLIQEERKGYKIKGIEVETVDEMPFDIPETWKWVRLQDIVKKTIKRGKSPKYAEKSNIQVFAQKCNVKSGGINMNLALFLDEAMVEKYPMDEFMCDGDIVINSTGGGTMGRVGIFCDSDRVNRMRIVPDGHVTVIRACDSIDYKYLYYFIKQNQKYLETQGEGSTNQTELKPITIASLMLPLPPLKEQHRIVAKMDELLPMVDRYAEAYEKLEKFNAKFPEDMKKSILQCAIQGKLVEQRAEEGTAEELFRQILDDKQKRLKGKKEGKLASEKFKDGEIPYDIPESWKWVRFGHIMINRDAERIPLSVSERQNLEKKYDYYGASGVIDKVDKFLFNEKLLLIGEDGANLLSRSTPIAYLAEGEYWVNNHAHVLDCNKNLLYMEYVMYYINAISLAPYVTGTAQPKMNQEKMNSIPIALPPYAEQIRIVEKIEELLPYCERLKK